MKKKNRKRKPMMLRSLKSDYSFGKAIGLSDADILLVDFKVQLSIIATRAIADSGLKVNEIVARSGIARSKVSAIKNGCLAGISCDLFLKVISVTGTKLTMKVG